MSQSRISASRLTQSSVASNYECLFESLAQCLAEQARNEKFVYQRAVDKLRKRSRLKINSSSCQIWSSRLVSRRIKGSIPQTGRQTVNQCPRHESLQDNSAATCNVALCSFLARSSFSRIAFVKSKVGFFQEVLFWETPKIPPAPCLASCI